MARTRHCALPLAIDRRILLPDEELMRRMDQEYSEQCVHAPEDVGEMRGHIEQSGKVLTETG